MCRLIGSDLPFRRDFYFGHPGTDSIAERRAGIIRQHGRHLRRQPIPPPSALRHDAGLCEDDPRRFAVKPAGKTPLELLEMQYVAGDISETEFLRKR